jgi:hypothetical protein
MDIPLPRAGYGVHGHTIMIWWFHLEGSRYAITIEEDDKQWWLLFWHHLQGCWMYRVFEELEIEPDDDWVPLHGDIQEVARVDGEFPLFLVIERMENPDQLVWVICVGIRSAEEEETYGVLWELRTSVRPNWETRILRRL